MVDKTRAVIFGRDAVTYEEARPSYPGVVLEHVTSLVDAIVAAEVGAGTGKATAGIANRDLTLTCLEPSPEMAAVLDKKRLPGVTVVVSTFEDWEAEPETVDLIYAAQAWHWVDEATGLSKALSLLRPGGVLALIWNIPVDRYARHLEIYQRHAPHLLAERDERIQRRDEHDWCADMDNAGFVATVRFTHRWSEMLSAVEYRALYSTYSDHLMLEEPIRTRLLDDLAGEVVNWGGTGTVHYRTEVFSGRKPVPLER